MFNLNNTKTQSIIIGLLVMIVIAVVVFALNYRSNNQDTQTFINQITSNQIAPDINYNSKVKVELKSSDTLSLNGRSFSVTNGWKVTEAFIGNNVEGVSCIEPSPNCVIYSLTKDNKTFYLSVANIQYQFQGEIEYKNDLDLETIFGIKDFNYAVGKVYVNVDNNGDVNKPIARIVEYKQEIFGCTDANLCFSSSLLPSIEEENKIYINSFNELLLSLSIN
jgi:hypothetical protein